MYSASKSATSSENDQSKITKMTYDEFLNTISSIPGGTVFMAMPCGADLTTVRFIASVLLPTGCEVIVDDEVFFLYASFEEFNDNLLLSFGDHKFHVVATAITKYHCALRCFLNVYQSRFYRLWESGNFVPLGDYGDRQGKNVGGGKTK